MWRPFAGCFCLSSVTDPSRVFSLPLKLWLRRSSRWKHASFAGAAVVRERVVGQPLPGNSRLMTGGGRLGEGAPRRDRPKARFDFRSARETITVGLLCSSETDVRLFPSSSLFASAFVLTLKTFFQSLRHSVLPSLDWRASESPQPCSHSEEGRLLSPWR